MKTAAFSAALLLVCACAATARSVIGPDQFGQIYIPAARTDRMYKLKCDLSSLLAARQNRATQEEYLLDKPLSQKKADELSRMPIRFVTIADGALPRTFDRKDRFPLLWHVALMSNQVNASCLEDLARNYPCVASLSIDQDEPLSAASIACLKSFTSLQNLELYCPLPDANALSHSLPQSLVSLSLARAVSLPRLPHLQELSMRNCKLDRRFLDQLEAPSLTYLCLVRVRPSRDFFQALARFKHLRKLSLTQTAFNKNDIACMLRLPYLSVQASQP